MANNAVINFIFNSAEAEKQLNAFKSKIKATGDAIGNSFGGALAAVGTLKTIGNTIKGFYNEVLDTALFAERWNLPVEEVSKFANAFEMMGGSAEEARGVLGSLEQAVIDLRANGGGALKDVSARMAMAVQNWDGSFKTSIDLIAALREEYGHLNEVGQEDALKKLGISSPTLIRYLRLSNEEFAKVNDSAERYGVINTQAAEGIKRFNDAWNRLKASFKGFQLRFFQNNEDGMLNKIIGLMDKLAESSDETKGLILGVITAIAGFGPAVSLISNVTKSLGLMGTAVKLVLGAFNPWVVAIGTVIGALTLLYKTNDKFKGFVDTCIKYKNDFIEGFIEGIFDALKWLAGKIPFWGDDMVKSLDDMQEKMKNNLSSNTTMQELTPYNPEEDLKYLDPNWSPNNQYSEDENGNLILPRAAYADNGGITNNNNKNDTVNNYDNKTVNINVYTSDYDNGRRLGSDIRGGITQQQSSGVRMGG